MDIDTTLDWLMAIAVLSGLGFVFLLGLSHREECARADDEGTRL
ncbi:MAG: hypothetical protein REJ24_07400 [Rhodocyclaceae bacterium]|nr:hypothetical protein [Pseudomonadota bacterium]MDQ7972376.1 hypothetical protein [Rhodocyclaceae bacterium]